jgi:hypothetical protein
LRREPAAMLGVSSIDPSVLAERILESFDAG